ncbi:unnamed protein product [Urochloa decumbens]|uniref:Uncharacterized protein n=1 Tax=Urochloa decumbens TaxID=240449 RepID=A0ABC9BYI7_9POAL
MGMVIGGVPVEKDDVFVVVNKEEGPQTPNGCNAEVQHKIEMYFELYKCVILEAKDMPHLMDYFGGLWTEDAQYKISRVKKWWYRNRYTYALAYKGELKHALGHVNRYLGGHIRFISDDFERLGPPVEAAGTDEKRVTGHSGRCFIVGLDKFST